MSTELEAVQKAGGVAFAPDTDAALPARFRGLADEWAAARRRCALFDARFRGLLRLTGTDRVSFLQGMVSNDVAGLQEGAGTYAAVLTQQAKVVSDLRLYVLADEIWLDIPAARTAAVRESLERYLVADDVEFVDDGSWAPLVCLEGPHAHRVAVAVLGEAVDGLHPFAHRAATFDGTGVRVVAATHTGENGYVLFGNPDAGARLWAYCCAAGAEPVGLEALDVLRLEAGIPWHGRDMDETTLIGEVGLEAAISYTKGCYLGQEVVERVSARGQVHRKLVGLLCEGEQVPPPGSALVHEGKEVGRVTSAARSPARDAVIALGYARRELCNVGRELQVTLPHGTVVARVSALPFYSPPRETQA